jgi:hypothetical protein
VTHAIINRAVLAVCALVVGFLGSLALYRLIAFRAWRSWPETEGTVESAEVKKHSAPRSGIFFLATLTYSYAVNSHQYLGRFAQNFEAEEEAEARMFTSAMLGSKVPVRYHPRRFERSMLDIKAERNIYDVPVS